MRSMKLFGYTKKRKVTTTASDKKKPAFADLVGRNFTADRPNQVYVGDISYLPIADGSNMYLATVIDCYSRRLVVFAIADHMRTSLIQDAPTAAKASEAALKGQSFTPTTAVSIPRKHSRTPARHLGLHSRWDTSPPWMCPCQNQRYRNRKTPAKRINHCL